MSVEQARKDLAFVQEYQAAALEYCHAHKSLIEIHGPQGLHYRDMYSNSFLPEAKNVIDQLRKREQENRGVVVRGAQRMQDFASEFGLSYVFEIYPPPAIGGAVIQSSLFQLVIQTKNIPYGAGFPYSTYHDVIEQVLHGCREKLDGEEYAAANPPPIYKRAAKLLKAIFSTVLPTEKERITVRWILIVAVGTLIFKAVGYDIPSVLKLFFVALLKRMNIM